ncbi:MAG: response regulator [Luteolibacter sp.]|jgi:DNA-binding NtrC family response regulator|nr:response regulator [Luteolibacter sp.]
MTARPILIIEDEHALGTALSFLVRRMGHLPTLVASATAGLNALGKNSFAAVVLDIGLPDMSGLEVLERLRRSGNLLPVLVITAHATLDHAIHSQKSGASGYLTKPLDLRQFEQALGAMLAPGLHVEEPLPASSPVTLIGAAPCLRETFLGIARACAGDFPALITGPSGAGKSLTAAVIHAHSRQSGEAMDVLVCSCVKDAMEFERPGGGTLVLDEVTELAADLQARLAAWLAGPPSGHARVLATIARDPREAVRDGALREDLYYALSTLTIPLPPLCERSGDIPALSMFFAGLRGDSSAPQFTPPVLAALQAYPWPGNVRELRHVVDYAATMSGGGPIFLGHLPAHVAAVSGNGDAAPGELEAVIARWLDAGLALPEGQRPDYEGFLEQIETVMTRHLLERHDQKPTRLAAALRIHRATLRQKLRRFGLQRDES